MDQTGRQRSRGRRFALLAIAGVAVLSIVVFAGLPRPVSAFGVLGQCPGGWPVIAFEGDTWVNGLPADMRANPPTYLPIATVPGATLAGAYVYDEAAGELRNSEGATVARNGDRVRITGA